MRRCALGLCTVLLAACFLPPSAAMAAPPDSTAFRLADYQWKNRVLLLFAPSTKAPGYEQQQRLFAAAEARAYEARDLLLVELFGKGRSRAAGTPIAADAAARLRERFGVAPEAFALILIGKDGTEKRRDTAPVKPEAIFDAIDAMPMRQQEMERQGGGS